MQDGNIIEVRNVSKSFKVYPDRGHSLKEKMISVHRNRYEVRQVLKDISFDVRKGESIGLIGHNGCGKSTMLKMLTRIMYPDQGTISICGRVSSLLELGAGFHPDLSGRENIYINASIFGLTRKEIDAKLEEIIAFSELQEFIDNPVRTYSSGMYMRLAFAVAINVNADVLIVDEILAVGDINFQRKCLNKMREIQNQGTTVVLVSHSMEQIMEICDRSVWIHQGHVMAIGETEKVAEQYMAYMDKQKDASKEVAAQSREIEYLGKVSNVEFYRNGQLLTCPQISRDDSIRIKFRYEGQTRQKILINIDIVREDFVFCYTRNFDNEEQYYDVSEGVFVLDFEKLPFFPAKYFLNLHIVDTEGTRIVDEGPLISFDVVSGENTKESGAVWLKSNCCMEQKSQEEEK